MTHHTEQFGVDGNGVPTELRVIDGREFCVHSTRPWRACRRLIDQPAHLDVMSSSIRLGMPRGARAEAIAKEYGGGAPTL